MEVGRARVEGVGIVVVVGRIGAVVVEFVEGEGVKGRSVVQASQQR